MLKRAESRYRPEIMETNTRRQIEVLSSEEEYQRFQLEAARPQPSAQDVLERERPEVSNVHEVIHSGAAGIHADGVVVERRERLYLLRESVVETKGHLRGKLLW